MPLPILFQDQHVVVVHKFSGLLVHRSAIDRQATEFALQMVRDQIGQTVYPVHRLDRPTSGALIFALSSEAARELSQSFARLLVRKEYLAVVRGVLREDVTLDYPLREELDAKSDTMARRDKPAQSAITEFSLLARHEFAVQVDKYPTSRYSLVRAVPRTGRKHQIRRHLHHLGHPIIGDVSFGSGKHNRFFRERFGVHRLLLACTRVVFPHPVSGEPVAVEAPLSEDFARVVKELGWEGTIG